MAVPLNEKIDTILTLIKEPGVLNALISLRHSGYLEETGWLKSYKSKRSVDNNGKPIPWVTYSFIDFISSRLNKDLSVFEYGSGNSTLYYAAKVNEIIAVEHNRDWISELQPFISSNGKIVFNELNDSYPDAISKYNKKFDIVIVDAEYRNECIYKSIDYITERGVIVLDDSERPEYAEAISFLANKGYKRIEFTGMAPGILFRKSTAVFYKTGNCLGI